MLDAQLALPGATIDGRALEIEPHYAHVTVADATLALGPLAASIPLLGAVVPPTLAMATARFNLDFSGDPDDLASATLHVGGLSVASGPGRLAGSIDVEGLRPTRVIRVAITDGALDLGALGPDLGLDLGAPDGGDGPALDPSSATAIRLSGDASAISLEILELSESALALRGAARNGLAGGVAAPLP